MSATGVVDALKILRSAGWRVPSALTPQASNDEALAFVETWASELAAYDDDSLIAAARREVRGADQFPVLSGFIAAVRRVDRDLHPIERKQLGEYSAAESVETPPERRAERLRELRELIAEQTGPLFTSDDGKDVTPL